MPWQYETGSEKLTRLRAALAQAQHELIEAEANLADRMADVNAFEFEYEARVGHLLGKLEALEAEVNDYLDRIQRRRNERIFGTDYRSADEQYRRTWQTPPGSAPKPPPAAVAPATEAEIKRLYRQLARRFHPDLARDETDRAYRTDKMAAINDAYAARSLAELLALAQETETQASSQTIRPGQTEEELAQVLEQELARIQRRLRQIDFESHNLHNRPSVQLSLDVKLARQQGRDLLADIAVELERKIARKRVERDMIKAQFDSLGPEPRIGY